MAGAGERARLQAEYDTLSWQLGAPQALADEQGAQERLWAERDAALRRVERAQAEVTPLPGACRAPAAHTKFKPGPV